MKLTMFAAALSVVVPAIAHAAPVLPTIDDLETSPAEGNGIAQNGVLFVQAAHSFPIAPFVAVRLADDGSETPLPPLEILHNSETGIIRTPAVAKDEVLNLRLYADQNGDGVADEAGGSRDMFFVGTGDVIGDDAVEAPTIEAYQSDLLDPHVRVVSARRPSGAVALILFAEGRQGHSQIVDDPPDGTVELSDYVDDGENEPTYSLVAVNAAGQESSAVHPATDHPSGYAGCTNVKDTAPAAAALAVALLAIRRRRVR